MKHLSVKNWERFQHYKDRDPPWIKLYRDMLTSESWVLGTDLSRVVQIASTLLAARYSNKIPYRFDLLERVMSLDCSETAFKKAVDHLIAMGFLSIEVVTETEKIVVQDASTPLATCTSEGDQRRAEKRQSREEARALALATPGLNKPVFEKWEKYRSDMRKPLTPYSYEATAKTIAGVGDRQDELVQNSITNDWQGLFPERLNGKKQHGVIPTAPMKLMTAEEAEAIERARGEHAQH